MLPALIGVLLGLLIRFLILYFRKRKKSSAARVKQRQPLPSPQPWQPQKAGGQGQLHDPARTERPGGQPVLKGVAGYYAGSTLELNGEPLTLGRDARAVEPGAAVRGRRGVATALHGLVGREPVPDRGLLVDQRHFFAIGRETGFRRAASTSGGGAILPGRPGECFEVNFE